MSANRLFLVCSHCKSPEHALLLADRADGVSQYEAAPNKRADKWFAKHMGCGGGSDHFQLAYNRPQDWDLSPPANPVASSVRAEIAEAQIMAHHNGTKQ